MSGSGRQAHLLSSSFFATALTTNSSMQANHHSCHCMASELADWRPLVVQPQLCCKNWTSLGRPKASFSKLALALSPRLLSPSAALIVLRGLIGFTRS